MIARPVDVLGDFGGGVFVGEDVLICSAPGFLLFKISKGCFESP